MKSLIVKTCLLLSIMLLSNCSTDGSTKVVIVTNYGNIELQLYDKTPKHVANFTKLAKEGFYDGLLFHRVIKDYLIQGGDPDSKNAAPGTLLGTGGTGTVAAEIVPEYIHKRGALAAYRPEGQSDPTKASSASQFYIVHGKVYTDYELDLVEEQIAEGNARDMYYMYFKEEEDAMSNAAGQTLNLDSVDARATRRASAWLRENPYKMKAEDRKVYTTIGGFPFLDGEYTVFGEVVKGFEVINKIVELETDYADRPKTDVKIKKIKVK